MVVGLGRVVGSNGGDFVVLWSPGSASTAGVAEAAAGVVRVVCLLAMLTPTESLVALRATAEALLADRAVVETLVAQQTLAEVLEALRAPAQAFLTTIKREC